ncbi:MAG: nucleoside triphosphate pyrophosphohydrolase [Proteobacteria bacterium]|nr:nucleoside triphosphate pyrophosphohydrolase [Pseudomonadota bacterium]MBU1738690.1 nucleoside triphosphate pyrophosphohydrolase [Pseudomonadota bacterium]
MILRTTEEFGKLIIIINKLRAPGGCPWDQKQTVDSFSPYLIEEMHELLEAISSADHEHIKEELGDVLFQLLFLGNLFEEKELFSVADSIRSICEKMVRRHPHVFGDTQYNSDKEFRKNWNLIKEEERKEKNSTEKGIFSFPKSLPALLRAQRVSNRAVSSGFEWPDLQGVIDKLDEEILELKEAVTGGDRQAIEDEIGDVFFTLVNVARKNNLDSESVMQGATDKFIRRYTRMSEIAGNEGHSIEDLDITEMKRFWEMAKKDKL